MPSHKTKLYICNVDSYYAEGFSLLEAYEKLYNLAEEASSPNNCNFYEATPINVKMELIPTLTKE